METQDISGKEQESICIRYVERSSLTPVEVFLGLYDATSTTGQSMAAMIEDVCIRLNLDMQFLRSQTYDGAANMSGIYNGCQALIAEKHPLALYVHCGAHCVNLVAQSASAASTTVQAAMQWVQELGNFYGAAIKYRQCFAEIAISTTDEIPSSGIKPLCPAHWLMRVSAISSVLDNYEAVLKSLEETSSLERNSRAVGLLNRFQDGSTLLGLHMALKVFQPLESLNKSLQSSRRTVSGMLDAVETVKKEIKELRKQEEFQQLFRKAAKQITELGLEEVALPRKCKPPNRLTGPADSFHHDTVEDHFRTKYYEMLDTTYTQLADRFDRQAGLLKYRALEQVLLTGNITEIAYEYPELNTTALKIELPMFRHQFRFETTDEAVQQMQKMKPEVQELFSEVRELFVLLLVSPASSCTAERSFSSLRRLKTWLRNRMTQETSKSCCNLSYPPRSSGQFKSQNIGEGIC